MTDDRKRAFRAAMAEKGYNTMADLSKAAEIPYSTLLYKLSTDAWDKDSILLMRKALDLDDQQTIFIFGLS